MDSTCIKVIVTKLYKDLNQYLSGSVVGTWCDELPPDNLVIFARQIHIHFTFCNPYQSVSFLQNFADYEISKF